MKQVLSYVLVTLAVVALLAVPASAQVAAGLNELGGRGYVETGKNSEDADNLMALDLNAYYGRFLTDRFEIGPGINMYKLEGQPATGSMNVFVNYHFGDTSGRMVPFVEVAVAQFFQAGDDTPRAVQVGPGLKWFFGGGGGALNALAYYSREFFDADLNGGANGANVFGFKIGVAVYFGR